MTKLFEPAHLGHLSLNNRIIYPAIGTRMASPEGFVTSRQIAFYSRRAEGGAGMVTVESTAVDPVHFANHTQLRAYDDRFLPGLTSLAESIKRNGARAAIQLQHPGRLGSRKTTGVQPVAPSSMPGLGDGDSARELTVEEIRDLQTKFSQAARRIKKAGFECVELNGAHGYLLCNFLSPWTNHRGDGYGGSLERRARFAQEVVARVRAEVGAGFPIIFRLSANEFVPGGLTEKETPSIARLLEESGVDAISVSAGHIGLSNQWTIQPMLFPKGCLVPLAWEVKKAIRVPVVAVGRLGDPAVAERVLVQGKADFIAMGRGLLADPDLPSKTLAGRGTEVRHCISCNSCRDPVSRRNSIILCLLNPETGHEGEKEAKASTLRRVLVLGAGPAALEAARVANLRGHEVALWHESKSMDGPWAWLIRPYLRMQKDELLRMGVTLQTGKRIDRETVAAFQPDVVLVTPKGRCPRPAFPGLASGRVTTAEEFLAEDTVVGDSIAVLGAGNIGCQIAYNLSRFAARVTLVDASPSAGYGVEDLTRRVLLERLRQKKVSFLTDTTILRRDNTRLQCRTGQGTELSVEAETIVLALNSQIDSGLAESLKKDFHVTVLPYCERPQETYNAAREGAEIARRI